MAPVLTGNPDGPRLGEELAESFCRTDPRIARRFARVTFTAERLLARAVHAAPGAGALVDAVLAEVLQFQSDVPHDDIALLD